MPLIHGIGLEQRAATLHALALLTARTKGPDDVTPRLPGLEQMEEIGRGGFGVVYRAWQPEFGRFVAVKVLPAERTDDDTRRRVERESLALGSLSGHPNIVAVHAAGVTEHGEPYLVMPYLSGGSLEDRLVLHGAVPWPETLSIGVKMAGALETAHANGVLHRDVKPDNILFSDFGEPQLADFGIARLVGSQPTQDGSVATTILFAAPEVLSGEDPGPPADVYSLACTLYAALAGRAPFATAADAPLAATIARVVTEPARRPKESMPDSLWALLARGLAKSPDDRPRSAGEFGRALQRVQRLERLAVTPITLPGGASEDPEATVIVTPPPAPSRGDQRPTVLVDRPPPDGASPRAEGAGRRRRRLIIGIGVALVLALTAGGSVFALSLRTGSGEEEARPEPPATTATSSPSTTSTVAPASTTVTTGVTAERPSQGVDLFNGAIQALTPFSNDLAVLALSSTGTVESPENEAALLGAWYSLADWCVATGNGLEGTCYDLAAEFLADRFPRDPRTINDDTWPGSGAIGGVIDSGYNIGQQYLGLEPLQPPTFTVTSNGSRPGQDLLCEPNCTLVIDGE